jgi:hypothetical protein
LGNEEKCNREQPEDDVRRPSPGRRSEELESDNIDNLRQCQINDAEFLAQPGSVRLDARLRRLEFNAASSWQEQNRNPPDN